MDYLALASDGDGTLTRGRRMAKATRRALERLRDAGYKLILTTGESSKDLAGFPHLELFDRVVAENGATLYRPDTGAERLLSKPAPPELTRALRKAGVRPLKAGGVIVATACSQDRKVRATLDELGLDWQVVRNCKDLMVVPPGVDKATGLAVALRELRLPAERVVGVGNAENDGPLLEFCGLGAAVANAAPELKGRAALVTRHGAGRGVVELVERLLAGELRPPSRTRKSG
jgi:hydroxymethylpyrimidine pyrophosphatase-like HAD family hydrolase